MAGSEMPKICELCKYHNERNNGLEHLRNDSFFFLQESIDHLISNVYVWHKITCQFEHSVHCVIARGSCKSAKGIVNKAAAGAPLASKQVELEPETEATLDLAGFKPVAGLRLKISGYRTWRRVHEGVGSLIGTIYAKIRPGGQMQIYFDPWRKGNVN